MKWISSIFLLGATLTGAAFVYRWQGNLALPLAVAAIGLVLSCMVVATPGRTGSTDAAPERRRDRSPNDWPRRGAPTAPGAGLHRRR